jgi:GxxExxY protein
MKRIGLVYEEESYMVRGLIYEIRKQLDLGWPEEAYHQALLHLLKSNGIPVVSKPRKSIVHRGVEVHTFEADLLVWDKIVLELKVLPRGGFAAAHIAQIIHYLKCWKMDLGFLVNYGEKLANIQRIVWSEQATG